MINPIRLMVMTRKRQKAGNLSKGKFVVYTTDRKRFVVPLEFINNTVFRELFKMSEEEFGLPGNGPIILPCDAIFMDYIVSFLQQSNHQSDDHRLEKALLIISVRDV